MESNTSHSAPAQFAAAGVADICLFIRENRLAIERALVERGAVLLRGFDVSDGQDFDAAVQAWGGENFAYAKSLSNAVRVNVTERVFTANEAPPATEIFLHHEMAQTPIFPSSLMFFCETAPETGGETPLCRSDVLLEKLRAELPDLIASFEEKGVRYSNTMPAEDDPGSGQGRSWKSTLGAESRTAAEARLAELNYSWEWQDDGSLRITTPRLDAVRVLPSGDRSFFNQLIAAYRGWSDSRNEASRSISLGDGSPIDHAAMMRAIELAYDLVYDHQWQAGDVVLVDNFTVMHGRRPFAGKRRVLASLFR
ncbi:TauD/TfdA family dioxygenase [Pontixanthobacter luteolus]|uniref:TauD/TfdA family dioxygenase n=1 Tax=Pontixanthobacter luteolus TaxID=295089 RepID=UPI002303FDE6|nr:TauD/TfdA family dioxygenase [Pontixanthobacter luteolus]